MHQSASFFLPFFISSCRVRLTGASEPFPSRHSLCFTVLPVQKNGSLLDTFVTSVHRNSKTISLCLLSGLPVVIVKAGAVWPMQVAVVRHPASTAAGGSTCRGAAERGTRDISCTCLMFFAFTFLSYVCLFFFCFFCSLDHHLLSLPVRLLHAAAVVCHREPRFDWPTGLAEAAGGDSGRGADAESGRFRSERGVITFPIQSLFSV